MNGAEATETFDLESDAKGKLNIADLTASIGLRDGANPSGSAVFIVRGDGKELYRSKVLHVGASQAVSVDISAVTNLELIADGGNGNSNKSWAVWVDPEVRR